MAKIYQGGRATTDVPQPSFRADQMANRGVERELEQNKQEALQMYEQGLKLQASQSMDTLFQEFGNNPQELAAKLNDLSQKMGSEIPDLNMRANFKTNFIISSQSMINRAQANYDKIQYEKKRSSYFDTIQANNKNIQLAFENAFSGTASPDDLVSYQTAINQNKALINARNSDGTYMFSDAQRLSMTNSIDKLASDSFESALLNMDDDKRGQFLNNLANDSVILLSAEDEDKNIRQLNLKDAVDPTIYSDMKKSARILDAKIKKQKVAEWNANKSYSAVQLMSNPNEQNYKTWLYYNADASDKKKETMAKIAGFEPNENAETYYEDLQAAYDAINDLDSSEFSNKTYEGRNKILEVGMDIAQRIQNSNAIGKLNSDMLQKANDTLSSKLKKLVADEQITKLPDMTSFKKILASSLAFSPLDALTRYEGIKTIWKESVSVPNRLRELGNHLMQDLINAANKGKSQEELDDIYKNGMMEAMKIKYYDIPDVQNRNLVPGDTINIHGKMYKYLGLGDDMMLEALE